MAKANNETLKESKKKLSIQIDLNGLSFSVLDNSNKRISSLKTFAKERILTPLELLDFLKFIIDTEHLKDKSFDSVTIIYKNELSTLVPKELFDEEFIADYLKFNNKILPTDFISFDELNNQTVNVFVPLVNINNFIYDTFGTFTYKHFSTVYIDYVLNNLINYQDTKMFVNVDENLFEILVVKDGKLVFFNTFNYSTEEDFIYYILFTAEQLKLNPEVFPLVFTGNIKENSPLFDITYKYVRNVSIENGILNLNILTGWKFHYF